MWKCRSSVVGGDLLDAAGEMGAGIAHHDIDAAESRDDVADQGGDVVRLADIGHESLRLAEIQRRKRGVELAAFAAANRDVAAFLAQALRDGKADPAGAAGDQRRLAGKSELHGAILNRRHSGDSRRRC